MARPLDNANPVVVDVGPRVSAVRERRQDTGLDDDDDGGREAIDAAEVFGTRPPPSPPLLIMLSGRATHATCPVPFCRHADLIRNINDPEHPLTLEQLNVAQEEHVFVDDANSYVRVGFTPTIPHCSMATLIGLCIRVRLLRSLPERFKIDVVVNEGTHQSEHAGACAAHRGPT